MFRFGFLGVLVALGLVAGACTPFIETSEDRISMQRSQAKRLVEAAKRPAGVKELATVRYEDTIWLGDKGHRSVHGERLPSRYDLVTLVAAEAMTLREISTELSALTGIPVLVEDTVSALASGDSSGSGGPDGSAKAEQRLMLSYSGPLSNLLDQLTARFGYSWEYNDDTIYLLQYVTKTFSLHALPGTVDLDHQLSSSSSSVEGGGEGQETLVGAGGSQNMILKVQMEVWDDVSKALLAMLPTGSKVEVLQSSGTVTISSTPFAMRKAEQFIRQQNEILTRQVALSVQVYSVTVDASDNYNLNLDAAFERINQEWGAGWANQGLSSSLLPTPIGRLSANILAAPNNRALGQWSGSEAIIQAISLENKVSLMTSAAMTTLNNQVAPVQVVRRDAYLRSQETIISEGISQTSLIPGTVTTGFILDMLPRILADGQVLLQYSLSLSELLDIETFSADSDNSIQLPTVISRDFLQKVRMKAGDTLVLAGFDQNIDEVRRSGTGRPDQFLLGGGAIGAAERQVVVILITPRLLD